MSEDERAIREVVDKWMTASKAGDVESVLELMTDDVVFTVAGQEPFGKEEFEAAMRGMQGVQMAGTSEIKELEVLGDWAFIRNYIEMSVTSPDGGPPTHRSGYTVSLLRKEADGRWRLARDANLVS